jgi:hypothetical protein
MTNGLAVPDTCGSGFTMLSEYCVAMAAVSLARGWSGENGAPKSGVSALICENRDRAEPGIKFNEKAASPDETSRDLSDKFSAIEAK